MKISPTHVVYRNLALLYQFQGQYDDAIALYRRYLDLVPDDGEVHYNLALLYLQQEQDSEAGAAEFEIASRLLSPDTPATALNLGVAYNTASRPADAINVFEAPLDHDPTDPSAVLNLGYAALEAGEIERAQTCFGWCIDSCPPDSVYAQKAAHMLEASLAS
ncbi:MAG: tetratricopeptide repeat protein [Anaerolineae bacterium]